MEMAKARVAGDLLMPEDDVNPIKPKRVRKPTQFKGCGRLFLF